MEINFEKVGNQYVAEFKATADFNLHIERVGQGTLEVYRRGTAEGEYDFAWSAGIGARKVIDYDFGALVYPKYIKVVSGSEVVSASVNFNEGGGSGSSDNSDVKWEYYKIDWDKFDEIGDYESLSNLVGEADAFNVSYWGAKHVTTLIGTAFADYTYSKIAGTNKAMFDVSNLDGYTHEADEGSWLTNVQIIHPNIDTSFITPITKDEFFMFDDDDIYGNIVPLGGPV